MRSIFQDIQSELKRFIDSRRESFLIVLCEPAHSTLLLKNLEVVEDAPESFDIFLTFGHKFTDPEEYVREIPPIISRQLAGVNEELVKRGEPALPPPPADLTNESRKPPRRLVELMRHVESNLELLGYFRHTGQRQEQSIVMSNIGDLH
jgi:hypothetical protein